MCWVQLLISYNFFRYCQTLARQVEILQKTVRQFLTRFSRSDWLLAMLKIRTEHGSKVPVGKLFRKQKTTLNNIKRKVVLVIHRN